MKKSRSVIIVSFATLTSVAIVIALALTVFAGLAGASPAASKPSGAEVLHSIHSMKIKGACHHNCGGGGNNLTYHGGVGGVGVETAPTKSTWSIGGRNGTVMILQAKRPSSKISSIMLVAVPGITQ